MTAPTPPLELRGPAPSDPETGAAIDTAMRAALKGDFSGLDKLELDFLRHRDLSAASR